MTTSAQRLRIRMTGGGPWGFRLFGGGEDYPLVIAKLRKHSKAAESGLQEGDVLLGINGYSCRSLNHPTAMAMVDQAGEELTFDVLRGTSDKSDVEATFDALGDNLQAPADTHASSEIEPPSEVAEATTEVTIVPSRSPQPPQAEIAPLVNGHMEPEVHRQEETIKEGDTTRHVTTETSQQQFGGTTVTKVTREEVFQSGSTNLSPYPVHQQRVASPRRPGVFQPSPQNPPGVWQPAGAPKPLKVTSAPSNVRVEHNTDRSVTMSFGLGGGSDVKENIAPSYAPTAHSAPSRNPRKLPEQAPPTNYRPGCWHPSQIPDLPDARAQTPPEAMPVYERPPSPRKERSSSADHGMHPFWQRLAEEEPESFQQFTYQHLMRILTGPPGGDGYDSGPDSPGAFKRKKKIYSDSSFYDDPEHKYPTIEEQIKMARKVAQSLEDAHNRAARGQNMYMKRKQKAEKWTAGYLHEHQEEMAREIQRPGLSETDGMDEKYYNPDPWKIKTPWQPPQTTMPHHHPMPTYSAPQPTIAPKFRAKDKPYSWEPHMSKSAMFKHEPAPQRELAPISEPMSPPPPIAPIVPDAPPLPMDFNLVPKSYMSAKLDQVDSTNQNALSMDEFEKLRLLGARSEHKGLDPKLAFSLADDLRQMKGKGGRLFAKRRERSEKWTLETDTSCNVTGPNRNVMQKLIISAGNETSMGPSPGGSSRSGPGAGKSSTLPRSVGKMPQNRLKEMIEPPKPAMSPWDSAASFGTTERAFEHLDPYFAMKKGGYDSAVAKSLDLAAQRSYMTPFKPGAAGVPVNKREPKMPEFTSKIRPWTGESNGTSEMDGRTSSPPASVHSEPPFSALRPSTQATGNVKSTSNTSLHTSTSSSSFVNRQKGGDFLAPKAPRGWGGSALSEGPSSYSNTAQSGISSPDDSQKAFRPVRFSSPPVNAAASSSDVWKPTAATSNGFSGGFSGGRGMGAGPQGGSMSGSWHGRIEDTSFASAARREVSNDTGYCDL